MLVVANLGEHFISLNLSLLTVYWSSVSKTEPIEPTANSQSEFGSSRSSLVGYPLVSCWAKHGHRVGIALPLWLSISIELHVHRARPTRQPHKDFKWSIKRIYPHGNNRHCRLTQAILCYCQWLSLFHSLQHNASIADRWSAVRVWTAQTTPPTQVLGRLA